MQLQGLQPDVYLSDTRLYLISEVFNQHLHVNVSVDKSVNAKYYIEYYIP